MANVPGSPSATMTIDGQRITKKRFRELQERLSDPLLTALTITLAIFMFVIAPMQAAGVVAAHHFAIVFGLVLVAAVFIVSSRAAAVAVILIAIGLVVASTVMLVRLPSILDVYLDATAWLITGVVLVVVVARAVFARGQVTFHRVIGAVLLYLSIGLIFVALFCLVALIVPNAFTGIGPQQDNLAVAGKFIYFSFVTLTSVGVLGTSFRYIPTRVASRTSKPLLASSIRQPYWRG